MANILETYIGVYTFQYFNQFQDGVLNSEITITFLEQLVLFFIKDGKQNESDNKSHNLFQKAHLEFQTKHTERSQQLLFEVEWVRGSVWGGMKNVVASEVAGQTRWPWDGAGITAGLVLKVFLLNYFILLTEFQGF